MLRDDEASRHVFYENMLTRGWVRPESDSWLKRTLRRAGSVFVRPKGPNEA